MTLPQNVEDAVKLPIAVERCMVIMDSHADAMAAWQTIRAHLMSQEAEIKLLRVGCEQNLLHAQMAESRLAAANAQLRLMHRVLSQAVCVACADDGSAKDHELDKLEGVLRDQGWITSAVVPSTPTDEHLQGAGDEA